MKILFVDISTGITDTVIKVFAFIGVGVMFIVIGTMYSRKYGNQLKGEFQLSNIFGEIGNVEKNSQTKTSKEEANINSTIEKIDISKISSVIFKPNNGKAFSTKSKNLMKIVAGIMGARKQAIFKPGELQNDYDYVVKNYKSSLNKTELARVQNAMKDFVDTGGEVIIK